MGVGCKIVTDKGEKWLDRLYHFDEVIQVGCVYTATDFTQEVGRAMELKDPESNAYHWLGEALKIATKAEVVAIVSENDEAWWHIHRLAYWKKKVM